MFTVAGIFTLLPFHKHPLSIFMDTTLSTTLLFPLEHTIRYHAPQLIQQTAEHLGWLIEPAGFHQWHIFAPDCKVAITATAEVSQIVFSATDIATEADLTIVQNQMECYVAKLREVSTAFVSGFVEEMKEESTAQKIKSFFMLFVPTRQFLITPLLIDINILIFIAMAVSGMNVFLPDNEIMLQWGANFAPNTIRGEWWRLFTSMFLHFGILHLLMNMYALAYIGALLEPLIGKVTFLLVYLIAGIAASTCSLWWYDFTIAAGASGAIFGMYGVFIALLLAGYTNIKDRKAILTSMLIFVGFNLLNGFKEGIDNAAHIGGLLSGLIIGLTLYTSLNNEKKKARNAILAGLFLVTGLITFGVYSTKPDIMGIYEAKMEQITEAETKSLQIFSMSEDSGKDALLQELKTRSIYCNEECISLSDSLLSMKFPAPMQQRNKAMHEYFLLRREYFDLIYKAISEDNMDGYQSALQELNSRIEQKMKAVTG